MCARYFLNIEEHENETISEEIRRRYKDSEITARLGGQIVPSLPAPVLCRDRKGGSGYFLMKFGLPTRDSRIINARSETACEKPMFRPLIESSRRCLIPASSYTEWEKQGKQRIPYEFKAPDARLLYFAGLYRLDGNDSLASFVILTRNAPTEFNHIHDRMPLILTPEEQKRWLFSDHDYKELLSKGQTDLVYARS